VAGWEQAGGRVRLVSVRSVAPWAWAIACSAERESTVIFFLLLQQACNTRAVGGAVTRFVPRRRRRVPRPKCVCARRRQGMAFGPSALSSGVDAGTWCFGLLALGETAAERDTLPRPTPTLRADAARAFACAAVPVGRPRWPGTAVGESLAPPYKPNVCARAGGSSGCSVLFLR
jgi:hypothetical protein